MNVKMKAVRSICVSGSLPSHLLTNMRCVELRRPIHIGAVMRTNIELDDKLLAEAMAATGLSTKKATVEEALRRLVRQHRQRNAIADMAGLGWQGDLDSTRQG